MALVEMPCFIIPVDKFVPMVARLTAASGSRKCKYIAYRGELSPISLVYGSRREVTRLVISHAESQGAQGTSRKNRQVRRVSNGATWDQPKMPAQLAVPLPLWDFLTAGAIAPRYEAKQLYVSDCMSSQPFAELRRHCANILLSQTCWHSLTIQTKQRLY